MFAQDFIATHVMWGAVAQDLDFSMHAAGLISMCHFLTPNLFFRIWVFAF